MGVLDNSLLNIYFIIVFLTMIFAFVKVGINKTSLFIILVFWEGLFQYLGFITNSDFIITIRLLLYYIYLHLFFKRLHFNFIKINKNIIIAYLIFVIIFWISYF